MRVALTTTLGRIVLELFPEKAPFSVENFLHYVRTGFYNGTLFHRVITKFIIQGGGYVPGLVYKTKPHDRESVRNEANNGLPNIRYSVAMARKLDPHSADTQFFINVVNNDFLNFRSESPSGWGYAVFGHVVEGTDVVDAISKVKVRRTLYTDDVPADDILILGAEVLE